MSLELYHKLMQDEDLEGEEVVCEEGEECPVEEEVAVEEGVNRGDLLSAIIHFTANSLQFVVPLIFFTIDSATSGVGGIFDFTNLFSGLLRASINSTHGSWYFFTFILGTLVWFLDLIELWDGVMHGWGLWISILIAITNISLYVMVLALA